ncbi:MAG: hypothetical protein EOM54_13320, partial [Clostridia bacterium]|nr:hypothetical protein [Clostridia bacterium]
MSITSSEFLSVVQATNSTVPESQADKFSYIRLLDIVRTVIAEKHSGELASALDSPEAAKTLKALILKYCVQELAGREFEQETLVEKIYQDMAGLGILTE